MKLTNWIERRPMMVPFGRRGGGNGSVSLFLNREADLVRLGAGSSVPVEIPAANNFNAGVMSSSDKGKLDNLAGSYSSVAHLASSSIDPTVQFVQVAGFHAPGDGGGALYARAASQPAHGGRVRTQDGTWWEITEEVVSPEMYGAIGNDATDDTDALMAMTDHARQRGYLKCIANGAKTYCYTIPQFLANIEVIEIDGRGSKWRCISGSAGNFTYFVNAEGLSLNTYMQNNGGAWFGGTRDYEFGQLISSADAGSTTITIRDGSAADVVVGKRVLIYGFDVQSTGGFPPNPRHFEWNEVVAVNGATVTLKRPLHYGYDEDWPVLSADPNQGPPRILSLYRPGQYVEHASLVIRNMRFLPDPGWADAAGGTEVRNGRISIYGCRQALIENVSTSGGMYVSTSEFIEIKGGDIGENCEGDKIINDLRFTDWTGKSFTQGTGIKRIHFSRCKIRDALNMMPQDSAVFDACELPQAAAGSSTATLTSGAMATKKIIYRNGCLIRVTDPNRNGILAPLNDNFANVTVVDANTLSLPLAAYESSRLPRGCFIGQILYDRAKKEPALKITRLPYLHDANTVRLNGRFLRNIQSGDVLTWPVVNEFDTTGLVVETEGQELWPLAETLVDAAFPVSIQSRYFSDDSIEISSDLLDEQLNDRYFPFGHAFLPHRLVINIQKAYTGGTSLILRVQARNPSHEIINVNTAHTGLRIIDLVNANSTPKSGDTFFDFPPDPFNLVRIAHYPGGDQVSAPEEAPRWSLRLIGEWIRT